MRPKDIVHRFLASIGRPDVAEQYLQFFQAERKERFAFVIVHPQVLESSRNALVADLLLLQKLELCPVLCTDDADQRQELISALPDEFPIKACIAEDAAEIAAAGCMPAIVAVDARERGSGVGRLQAGKVIYLITRSGLQPLGAAVRSLVNLRTDYDELAGEGVLSGEQRALLGEIRSLFHSSEHTFTVSVTSAHDLLRELFTVKGAGTLVRRGTAVERLSSYQALERDKLAALFGSAFGRLPGAAFYERPILQIYLASRYRGAAVLEGTELAPYLSKFAVDMRAQGEGIGGDLWRALTADHERFFWRSRPKNPIASWYAFQCDGLVRGADWTVFWRGLQTSEIARAVELATSAPIDFEGSNGQ